MWRRGSDDLPNRPGCRYYERVIRSVTFRNFKRFERFSLAGKGGNVLVGPNNSGKSSILDAFRLLAASFKHTRTTSPKLLPLDDKGVFDGYNIPDSVLPFGLANITRNYNSEDAVVCFQHENGAKAYILLHPERPVRFYIDRDGRRFQSSTAFRKASPINLVIVPTLSPLEADEQLLQPETIQRNRNTRLAARNFRNIWYRETPENFNRFKEKVERAWPGIELSPPELVMGNPAHLEMFFTEDRITREIQWAGFGFQVWLQIHTHMNNSDENSVLIIDEPDIYLHPELQHRLYHDIREQFRQYFIATHATEIINEADTDEIVVINPSYRSGKRIQSDAEYESMLNYIGSAENADFAKISRSKKIIFVEGHDARILRRIAKRLKLEALASDPQSPIFQLGGFSQWRRAEDTAWAFRNLLGVDVAISCVFDLPGFFGPRLT
jgi:AAA15 family ATPase/GTPase